MLKLHHERFVNQVEKALNDRYNLVNSEHNEEDAISIPEARAVLETE